MTQRKRELFNLGGRVRKRRAYTVKKGIDPLVKQILKIADDSGLRYADIADGAGVGVSSLTNYKRGHVPSISNFQAILNELGYELVIQKMDKTNDCKSS